MTMPVTESESVSHWQTAAKKQEKPIIIESPTDTLAARASG